MSATTAISIKIPEISSVAESLVLSFLSHGLGPTFIMEGNVLLQFVG